MKHIFLLCLLCSVSLLSWSQAKDMSYYLEQAKANSPLIHTYSNERDLLTLDLDQLRSVLMKPEISLGANLLFAPVISHDNMLTKLQFVTEDAITYAGYDLAATDGGQYQAGVSITQPLLNGPVLQSYENKNEISKKITSNNIKLSIHELEQLVAYQYLLCIKSGKEAEYYLDLADLLADQIDILNTLVESSIYSQADLLLLGLELDNMNASYYASISDYRTGLYDLNLICGIEDTAMVELDAVQLEISWPDSERSAFAMSYKLDSLSLIAEREIFNQKYRAQISLFLNAGLNAVYLPSFNRIGFSTGLSLSWILFDGHQRDIQEQKTVIELNSLEFEKRNVMLKADLQRKKILQQIKALKIQEKLVQEQIEKYTLLAESYQKSLQLGTVSIMDLKNIVKDMSAKKQELLRFEMEKQFLINSYNYWNF